MDPDAALAELLELTRPHLDPSDQPPDPVDVARIAELVQALDGWLFMGGFVPRRWVQLVRR